MKIFSNSAISLNFKLATKAHDRVRLGTIHDLKHMQTLRNQADAILVGGNTFRSWPLPLVSKKKYAKPVLNIILSQSLKLPFSEAYLHNPQIKPVVFTDKKNFNLPVEVCVLPEVNPITIVDKLKQWGVKNLLLECGATWLAQFLETDLLNEMNVTLCPKILKAGPNFDFLRQAHLKKSSWPKMKLKSVQKKGDEVFLKYQILTS